MSLALSCLLFHSTQISVNACTFKTTPPFLFSTSVTYKNHLERLFKNTPSYLFLLGMGVHAFKADR